MACNKNLNLQQEFRIAEKECQIGYYDYPTPLYATFHEDSKTFSLMWTEYTDDFPAFYDAYIDNQKRYGENHGVLAQSDMLPPPNAYTVSCVPWISFQHFLFTPMKTSLISSPLLKLESSLLKTAD